MKASPYPRPENLRDLHCKVRKDFKAALQRYASDRQRTMTHVVVTSVARALKRAGYWPVQTAELKEERRLKHLQRMAEGRKRKGESTPGASIKRKAAKRKGAIANRQGRPIGGQGGRPIGGQGGRPIGGQGGRPIFPRVGWEAGVGPRNRPPVPTPLSL